MANGEGERYDEAWIRPGSVFANASAAHVSFEACSVLRCVAWDDVRGLSS